jgi:DNA-binding HxlR family transcriptional regulator
VPVDNTGLEHAARRIGDRWTLRLIGALLDGERTFSELADEVEGIAPNILTARLRALQAEALIAARPYERRPLRMRYSLTEPGRRLAGSIAALSQWGARRDGRAHGAVHDACGTPLQLRPWCPTCERLVDDRELGEHAGEHRPDHAADRQSGDESDDESGEDGPLVWA